jgi:beta-glucosidase/6-phospho-beta-glucosidase/beta-galactosidase
MTLATIETFKAPLHFALEGVCGKFTLKESGAFQKIHSVVMAILSGCLLIFTIPIWFIGEVISICSKDGENFFNDSVPLGNAKQYLDPKKTKMLGTGLSTFQATSDPNFCKGTCVQEALKDPKLGLGGGVDILTKSGRDTTIAYLKKMNANTFRFSVEWADVNQNGFGEYIEAAKHFYSEGFKLVITLDHWMGNGKVNVFENPGDEKAFVQYASDAYRALRPYVSKFLTFNEPNVDAAQKYIMGELPPKRVVDFAAANRLLSLKLSAHAKTYDALHQLEKDYTGSKAPDKFGVGITHQVIMMKSNSRWNIIARIVAFIMTYIFHRSFMEKIKKMNNKVDFLGVQYYCRPVAGASGSKFVDSIATKNEHNPDGWMVEGMHYRFDPQGILPVLTEVYSEVKKPILVTEIGCAGPYEDRKEKYYKVAIRAMRAAQDAGVKLFGALFWTLFPNLEWQHGYDRETNFGILSRSRKTNKVTETKGYHFLRSTFANTRTC